jgi:hypothetical protein
VVPRHVLGGAGFVAPSEKVTVAYIGCGTQGLREMPGMISVPEIQIVAVCDPVKQSYDYVDWSPDGLRQDLAEALKKQSSQERAQALVEEEQDVLGMYPLLAELDPEDWQARPDQ